MTAGTQGHTGYMGNGQPEEGYGTAECCGGGSEQTGTEQHPITGTVYVDSQIGGIAFAQQDGIQGLYQQEGPGKA